MIVRCICRYPFQDERYGLGNRVANPTKDSTKARCTVCSTLVDTKGKEIASVGSKGKGKK